MPKKINNPFILLFSLLLTFYGYWLMTFWPGILGEDSLGILLEVLDPEKQNSGKPAFWYYFVRVFYEGHQRAEVPIGAMLLMSAAILARILAWCWDQKIYKTTIFLLFFVCLTPHLIFFAGSLYPDGIYSIAIAGLLFEIWLIAKAKKAQAASLFIIALTLPISAFARPNGIIFLIPIFILIFLVERRSKILLSVILLSWTALMAVGMNAHRSASHGAIYPMAIFETVNFLQPRPMNLWTASPRLSPLTVETLEKNHPLETYIKNYDPDYWDTLNFKPDGPRVMSIPKTDRKIITKEFLRYNVWHNIPKFMGSRVNIFLASAFADGGLPGFGYAKHVLDFVKSESIFRKFNLKTSEDFLFGMFDVSYTYRWIFWTPFLGIALLIWAIRQGFNLRDIPILLISLPMLIQLGAIFIFSIAAEYRYLLPFFTLSLVLLPIFSMRKNEPSKT
ncbi:hypothetical protein [Delftia sp. PE138]|uniref:hypothetical protein n=1 Tax=Delftia sp. PE138 TaxID=1812483 RepID=UPI001BAF2FE3|nr:hypothetical protein [Delftia sp. PE138]MBS3718883.1 hypothetical protein [Delftia sp. PE138]